jgi:hypothetical protein
MKNSGFYLTELRLSGNNLENALIKFEKGLNVITGPTNTGKSFIYQCINYMLGGSTPPKNIQEARSYKEIYLEIQSNDGNFYTLKSDLIGGKFQLFDSKIDKISLGSNPKYLDRKHNPINEDNVSAFLLSLNKLSNKKIRVNESGKTRSLSYRDLIKFLMVSEERIITQESPIVSHYTKKTEELNTLKLLLTGRDDSGISIPLSSKEITHRKGKIELLTELINNSESFQSREISNTQLIESLDKVNLSINEIASNFNTKKLLYLSIEKEHITKLEVLQKNLSEKNILSELLKRSNILKQQYETDISRLNATIEASYLLSNNSVEGESCPLCHNKILHSCNQESIDEIIESCKAEITKIIKLQNELIESVILMYNEIETYNSKVSTLEMELINLKYELESGIGKEIDQLLNRMTELNNRKSYLIGIKDISERVASYKEQKSIIESSISTNAPKTDFSKFTTSTATKLCKEMFEILNSIKYPNAKSVEYSEHANDFVISGNDRGLAGKGYRAITFATFILALQKRIELKEYSIGIPILDSPFVTYRKPKVQEGEAISIDLAMDFYRHLANDEKITQFIIIENEEPPADIQSSINHINFSGVKNIGRFGFIPTPAINSGYQL